MGFVRAAHKDDIPPGKVREFQVADKRIGLANISGKLCAFNNICVHQGGPLGDGDLVGQVVICPWHSWEYDVTTGKLVGNSEVGVETYPVEVRDDEVFVDIG